MSRLFNAAAALWLCGGAAAWAGDGGSDQGSVNTAWQTFCGVTLPMFGLFPACPEVPTVTQGILQLAAWQLVPPVAVRASNSTPLGQAVDGGNPSFPPATLATTPPTTAITQFPVTDSALSNLLPALTPLGFISSSKGPAAATQLYNTNANAFLYAVASGYGGQQPDTLFLFYDDPRDIINIFLPGQVVAEFSFPLVVLTSPTTETLVPTTLQFRATNARDCSASTVSGNFSGKGTPTNPTQTLMAAQIGLNCAVVFAPSPLSKVPHAIFEVAVPLIVTMATDPLYFSTLYSVIGGPWTTGVTGYPSGGFSSGNGVFPAGSYIGLAPSAQPLGPPPAVTPYALCANLPGLIGPPVPSVAAYYAIASDGQTLLSAPLPGSSTSACPF